MIVLCYHKVNKRDSDWNNITISLSTFREQMKYLKDNYSIIRTDIAGENDNSVAISFDDGYEDCITYILPILEEYNIPATFFISTGKIDTDEEDWCNELSRRIMNLPSTISRIDIANNQFVTKTYNDRLLAIKLSCRLLKYMNNQERINWMNKIALLSQGTDTGSRKQFKMLSSDQLKLLYSSPLVTIGAHTINHPSLARLSFEEQVREIIGSKEYLENLLGTKITEFAYPFGSIDDYTIDTIRILKKCGIKKAFTTWNKSISTEKNYEIPRRSICECELFEFKQILSDPFKF